MVPGLPSFNLWPCVGVGPPLCRAALYRAWICWTVLSQFAVPHACCTYYLILLRLQPTHRRLLRTTVNGLLTGLALRFAAANTLDGPQFAVPAQFFVYYATFTCWCAVDAFTNAVFNN